MAASSSIWMANPFSAVPTDFKVTSRGRTYFGNCIWDALGIPAILGADGLVETVEYCIPRAVYLIGSGPAAAPVGVEVGCSRWRWRC